MERHELITDIQKGLHEGVISKADLLALADGSVSVSDKEEQSKNVINIFYGIGVIVALVGIGILVAQHWQEIGFFGRIVVTLGISLSTYISALLFREQKHRIISQVFFTLSAVLAPLGVYVLLDQAGVTSFTWNIQALTGFLLLAVYGTAFYITRRNMLVLIMTAFASWTYYAILSKIFSLSTYGSGVLKWSTMLLGVAYICVAYGYKKGYPEEDAILRREKKSVAGILYSFGTLAVLGAGITLGGGFDIAYILLVFTAFYASVYVRSRSMLILAGLFLMGHIGKLTNRYFAHSIGWPVALIIAGFLIIGVGYLTYNLNKKYLSK